MSENNTCDCCTPSAKTVSQSTKTKQKTCPSCGQKGRWVDSATLKSQLSVSIRQIQKDVTYRFCSTQDCDVVYYAQDGEQYFTTEHIRVPVYQKAAASDDVPICYCFQYSTEGIRQEIQQTGHTIAIDDINAGIQAEQCACDWRNPQGNCCLGNVTKFVKLVKQDLSEKLDT